MFQREIKIRFTQDFVSPVLGNVYIGKILKAKPAEAQKWVALKKAEFLENVLSENQEQTAIKKRGRPAKNNGGV